MPNSEKKSQPSESERREFWERCGFKISGIDYGGLIWETPDRNRFEGTLPIDLNNLFKHAVPKISPKTLLVESYIDDGVMKFSVVILSEKQSGGVWCGNDINPALALFWAISEVMK